MDANYWKDGYKDSWPISAKKEEFIKNLIEMGTGYTVHLIGMGAGTTSYIPGNAADNKFIKGDADLYVEYADSFVEVTGPNIKMPAQATLWIRPDKIENSIKKLSEGKGKLHVVTHVQDIKESGEKSVRGVIIDSHFAERYRNGEFKIVKPFINGRTETYAEIQYNDPAVISFETVIAELKKAAST